MGLFARLRSSLTYPIAATLVLVTVVPVTLVGWLLASYNREHLTFVEKRFLSLEARGLAGEVSEFLESHRIQLQSTVRGLEAGGAIEVSGFEQLLQDVAGEQDRAFVYLQILDERGEGTFVRSPSLTADAEQILTEALAEAHAVAIAGQPVERLMTGLPSGEATKAIYAFPLRSADGVVWGSLTGILDLVALERRFDENAHAGFIVSLFDENGLVPVIAQDWKTGEVLMLAYMNAESLKQTLEREEMVYWSRSRKVLWHKGDTSGHIQKVKELYYDCDGDTILAKIEQVGGIACHTGSRSCFFTKMF